MRGRILGLALGALPLFATHLFFTPGHPISSSVEYDQLEIYQRPLRHMEFQGSIHAETAAAYPKVSLGPSHHEIVRLMNEAALQEDRPADWLEKNSEGLTGGPELLRRLQEAVRKTTPVDNPQQVAYDLIGVKNAGLR